MTDVLGNERPIEKTYEDGSFNCPFCWAAVLAPLTRCENPSCAASSWSIDNPAHSIRIFRALAEKQAQREAEEAYRKQAHESAMERGRQNRAMEAAWWASQREEAIKRHACLACFGRKSEFYRNKPVFVKHRLACPNAVAA